MAVAQPASPPTSTAESDSSQRYPSTSTTPESPGVTATTQAPPSSPGVAATPSPVVPATGETSENQTPSDTESTASETEQVVVELPHPVSVGDALTLRTTVDLVGLQYTTMGAAGGVSVAEGQSDADVIAQLDAATSPYGFTPAITAIVVRQPRTSGPSEPNARTAEPTVPIVSDALQDKVDSMAGGLPEGGTAGQPQQPEIAPPPASRSEQPQVGVQAEGDNAAWSPAYANSTAWEFESSVATIRHDLVWDGSTDYPWAIIDDFGLEIGDKQVNENLLPGIRPYCPDTSSETGYWARRVDANNVLSWTIMIPNNDPDVYRSYLDWENSTDSCKEMELAVGIGYPNRLQSYGQEFRIFTEIRTPRGNDAGTDVNSDLQAPSNDCPPGVNPNTTCMGLNIDRGYGGTSLLRTGTGKPFPGSWHWQYDTAIAEWVQAQCAAYGRIGDAYRRNNSAAGPLGTCETWEYPGPGDGRQQNFANGRIYWHPNTDAWAVHGAIGTHYIALSEASGPLRYPTSDELNCPTRPDCKFNRFETGNIYWSPTTGAHGVYGAIFDEYGRQGYENGRFGLPTTDEFSVGADRQVNFEGGWIRWIAATGAVITS
ncbi:hypothetical protein G4H71_13110 [Rhodococcus triatomae]|uniref:LGFP repeat-containing protein n=1 Tax=Rhodococcus triatomae TaxID=300028 RepID=A0A1G8H048_9NOCA|nr:hypothetical protein [Rhodococcus triatomae]QNG20247.1 hypothetical protein G4H72_17270 [Rhodococcus triatomae]QNG23838.1 hypothetical protein G4H71_13110 [Rhodococcus triatomae]SDH99976.1 LGFP repeat-containing protein [Rhodococcus triatomae]